MEALNEFLNSPAGIALIAAIGAAFADLATGVLAALRDGTFTLDSVAAFLRKHIAGRVAPLGVLMFLGSRKSNSPSVTAGAGRVSVSKKVSW